MAVEDVQRRMERITSAFNAAGVRYALIGGQAVALWVATKDPEAVRVTKDVDMLLDRNDLPAAQAAAETVGLEFHETSGIGMFLEAENPTPKSGVHLLWAEHPPSGMSRIKTPPVNVAVELLPGKWVIPLPELVKLKLLAHRHHDLGHIADMIDVGLIGSELLDELPEELRPRYHRLLDEGPA